MSGVSFEGSSGVQVGYSSLFFILLSELAVILVQVLYLLKPGHEKSGKTEVAGWTKELAIKLRKNPSQKSANKNLLNQN
ncbi:Oidioi.mRNA.OKI2018_I69.chr2.g4621.t1.cds [Oikopleura dioica]|uniref:Oidioi.mRNA.OKI2018_I69.chr2.g4621.t1.cds n=1 Tax=Oikopleura dioica TaxID=34765 RepID=A0ABN7SYB5_OIKDI|nr:Oidioi.mRNA.OKI2018_I69.chr2.g4621.t1.cds [Oikopleura dioica]